MEEAWGLRREVEGWVCWGGGCGMPYSRSLAGVGGRLDGLSEWWECWEGVEIIAVWAGLGLLGNGDGREWMGGSP